MIALLAKLWARNKIHSMKNKITYLCIRGNFSENVIPVKIVLFLVSWTRGSNTNAKQPQIRYSILNARKTETEQGRDKKIKKLN